MGETVWMGQRNQIDGLRGVAIAAVVLHHLFSQPLTALHLRPFGIPLNPLIGNGWLGVNLFFILSGFVPFFFKSYFVFQFRVNILCFQFFRLLH